MRAHLKYSLQRKGTLKSALRRFLLQLQDITIQASSQLVSFPKISVWIHRESLIYNRPNSVSNMTEESLSCRRGLWLARGIARRMRLLQPRIRL